MLVVLQHCSTFGGIYTTLELHAWHATAKTHLFTGPKAAAAAPEPGEGWPAGVRNSRFVRCFMGAMGAGAPALAGRMCQMASRPCACKHMRMVAMLPSKCTWPAQPNCLH